MSISHDDLKKALHYDSKRGRFFWIEKRRGIVLGSEAGSFDVYGYGQLRINGKVYKEHRLVWFYVTGEWPKGQIDHINHMRRDNRFENLRVVDNSENHMNRPLQANNSTGVIGVSWSKSFKKFRADITVKGKRFSIGLFNSVCDAAQARKKAEKEFGFHENHVVGYGQSKPSRA